MGLLVDGQWQDKWYDTKSTGGSFQRSTTSFRDWITADGSPGPDGQTGYKAEPGRYHLYVSLACPWAHRTLIARKLKKLEDVISLSVVDYHMGEEGWIFSDRPGAIPDPIFGKKRLYEIYLEADPHYTGRVTVPVLWDKQTGTIVNNESSEILRILNRGFDAYGDASVDLSPDELRDDIDAINADVYDHVNNGVYKCGFATTQRAYEKPFGQLFDALDRLEALLSKQRYLVASAAPTEADWRLFTTLIRFDPVYFGHFKCNLQQIRDYPNLFKYMLELYQVPGVAETVDFAHIKGHYYSSHATINPTGIIPVGPKQDLTVPHGRERLAVHQ
ncbi:glutathione S-transferase family protein [Aurantimonas coralicida]|uniref:glutathione S-transferase family protein n=1 Tax=Aurantimonas coralicida TaxID=182270 RepID=UPI001D17E722|nr:glutathione S-transferase family protein [Aurantimonas coralicida]MCC4297563.1 glutathione S-transferase family protein [Aurantimonas coralicida]MDE0922312.1 glutathione S-transferase family protein [Aurantimonas coralicida]